MSGSWELKFPEKTSTLDIHDGEIYIHGKPVKLSASTKANYPASDGWWTFVRANGVMGVGRVTGSGMLEIFTIIGKEVVPATVTKTGSKPKPKVPEKGKYCRDRSSA